MRLIKTMLAAAITLSAIGTTAHAEYPDKPIKMLVGYAPGGAADKLIRPITDRLSKDTQAAYCDRLQTWCRCFTCCRSNVQSSR
jgi:tripartite-type tricarboxylate transporter receptor subunit TctC